VSLKSAVRRRVGLGYVPGYHKGAYHILQRRLFGTRRFSREVEYRAVVGWLGEAGVRSLDVACGTGDFSWALALRGDRVVALDRDREALTLAREVQPHLEGVVIVEGDALQLPFRDGSFDLCFCNSSLEHFDDGPGGLREMARVLRPGGRLVLTTDAFPRRLTPLARWLPDLWVKSELRGADRHARTKAQHAGRHHVVRYYTPASLAQAMQAAGLEVREVRSYLTGALPRFVFELHLLLRGLSFYNATSQRLYPLWSLVSRFDSTRGEGYGVAALALKPTSAA
jgi:ubiquinone/menaquinone biosynthesis C-methylase UbiE